MTGIYIHIPFCTKKCNYCDFNSYSGLSDMSFSYGKSVISEMENSPFRGRQIDTVYIGGGTPTSVDDGIITDILNAVGKNFTVSENAEITSECNPGTADEKKLKNLRLGGVNRLSIGCQSADDNMLKTLGRIHTFRDFEICMRDARRAGFENISADLMFGLPEMSLDSWKDTMKKVTDFGPEHISAYCLKVEPGTPFFELQKAGKLRLPDDEESREMYDAAVDFLRERGYERYEISNFAKPGFESKHNLIYWTMGEYLGFGAGASSFAEGKRFSNPPNISDYMSYAASGGNLFADTEAESEADLESEFMFLGLRLDRGVSPKEFEQRFGKDMFEVFSEPLRKHLKDTKALIPQGGRIKISPEYTYVSNAIMSDFV